MKQVFDGRRLKTDMPYEAIVVDNNDPDRLGCVRARVPKLMDGIEDKDLPWARPRNWDTPFGQQVKQTVRGRTSMFGGVPRRGNKINLWFPTADVHAPTYDCSNLLDRGSKDPVYDVNYPNRCGMRLPNGLQILVDQQTNELFFINAGDYHCTFYGTVNQTIVGNQQLIISDDPKDVPAYIRNDPLMSAKYLKADPSGRIPFKGSGHGQYIEIKGNRKLLVHGNVEQHVKGNMVTRVDGNFKLKATGTIDIDGSQVDIN